MNSLEALRENIRENFRTVLPIMLIALLGLVNVAFGIAMVLPAWQEHQSIISAVEQDREAIAAIQTDSDDSVLLEHQIETAGETLSEAGAIFLSNSEAAGVQDTLYAYAAQSGVRISAMQVQPTEDAANPLYEIRTLFLQVDGSVLGLIDFVSRIREGSLPSVDLHDLNLTEIAGNATLTLNVSVYVSTHASGQAVANMPPPQNITPAALASRPTPTPTIVPTLAPETATATPLPSPTATPQIFPSQTPSLTAVGPGVYNDNHVALQYVAGTWETLTSQRGYNSDYRYSENIGAEVKFTFVSTDLAVQYVKFRNFGIFEIYVDDVLLGQVDSYAAEGTFGEVINITGLTYTSHTLTLRNTSQRNPDSTGNIIAIDAIHVLQPVISQATSNP